LYCLGTTHQFRKKGVARELISKAQKITSNSGYDSIILQTLTKERYEEFYKRLGFKTIYKKMLYTFYLN
jgi:GNAT superfamily N-acetyltransferase